LQWGDFFRRSAGPDRKEKGSLENLQGGEEAHPSDINPWGPKTRGGVSRANGLSRISKNGQGKTGGRKLLKHEARLPGRAVDKKNLKGENHFKKTVARASSLPHRSNLRGGGRYLRFKKKAKTNPSQPEGQDPL